jgi:hypothetical protein
VGGEVCGERELGSAKGSVGKRLPAWTGKLPVTFVGGIGLLMTEKKK